jgi:hypothetical protein
MVGGDHVSCWRPRCIMFLPYQSPERKKGSWSWKYTTPIPTDRPHILISPSNESGSVIRLRTSRMTRWMHLPSYASCAKKNVSHSALGIKPDPGRIREVLSPFQNIRCFSFVKQIYLDAFKCVDSFESTH